jgi:hypothetical protein
MPSFTRSRVARARATFNGTKRTLQRHFFDLWGRRLSFMAPYGKQSKAQKKAHARCLAKFMRLTKSIPISEWGVIFSTVTKHVRQKWLVRTNNADFVFDPPPLVELQNMQLPPILAAERKFVSSTRSA